MRTESDEYFDYLEEKYLPGRDLYLHKLFYPRILRELSNEVVVDLGCGTGSFLKFLASQNIPLRGIDSNAQSVAHCQNQGHNVELDDITKLGTLDAPIYNAVCDNVLEHLTPEQINDFLAALSERLASDGRLVAIVPDHKGFEKDPTHITFIDEAFLTPQLHTHGLKITKEFCYPFNSRFVGKHFYLNMQIFVIQKA